MGPAPLPQFGWYSSVRFTLRPDEVDKRGYPLEAEWGRLFEVREELEMVARGRSQWVSAVGGKGQFSFIFYIDSNRVLDEWKEYLVRAHPGRQVVYAIEEDTGRKWYNTLRAEAEQAASDGAVIEEWARRGGDRHLKTEVDFRLRFSDLADAQRAQSLVEHQWVRPGSPTEARTKLVTPGSAKDPVLTITHVIFVNAPLIAMLRLAAQRTAAKCGGRFDGWGAAIQGALGPRWTNQH